MSRPVLYGLVLHSVDSSILNDQRSIVLTPCVMIVTPVWRPIDQDQVLSFKFAYKKPTYIMSLMGEYRVVKYSSLFTIFCVIRYQFGQSSLVMLSPRQGKYRISTEKKRKKLKYMNHLKRFLVRKAQ